MTVVFFVQRSFRKELFEEAALRLGKANIKSRAEIERFLALAQNAYQIAGNPTDYAVTICLSGLYTMILIVYQELNFLVQYYSVGTMFKLHLHGINRLLC